MTNKEYREETKRTLPNLSFKESSDGEFIRLYQDEVGNKLNLCHMVLGLASEIGELSSCIGTELKIRIDRQNLIEELGDIYWYITNYCNLRDIPVPETVKVDIPNDMCFDLLLKSVGDLVDLIKKFIAYGVPINKVKELAITYDIYSALFLFENTYDIRADDIRAKNIAKLKIRFPVKYSDEKAINRNTEEEKKAL